MTAYETTQDAITSRFGTLVEDVVPLPTAYDNDDDPDLPDDAQHARVNVVWGDETQVTIGTSPRSRGTHLLIVQLFVPIDTGRAPMLALADTIKGAFRRVTVGDACFREPRLEIEPREGKWDRGNVLCPFFTTE